MADTKTFDGKNAEDCLKFVRARRSDAKFEIRNSKHLIVIPETTIEVKPNQVISWDGMVFTQA